jgi:bifunctional DNA-binding transcriptional regulator/antitoxin component of YhaV-PrlF toxin-antitoxin module
MARKSTPRGLTEPKTRYVAPHSGSAGRGEPGRRNLPPPEMLPDGTVRYFLVLGPKGRVLLPADMRAAMGLEEGDVITAWLNDGDLRMHSHRHGLRTIQAEAAGLAQGKGNASDELIAERRAEAAKDTEEDRQWQRAHGRKRR